MLELSLHLIIALHASGEESSASKKGKNTTGPPWDNKDETRLHKEGIEQAKWDFIVLCTEQAVAFLKEVKTIVAMQSRFQHFTQDVKLEMQWQEVELTELKFNNHTIEMLLAQHSFCYLYNII